MMRQLAWHFALIAALVANEKVLAQDSAQPAQAIASPDRETMLREADRLEVAFKQMYEAGDAAGALPLAIEALRLRREVLGERHPDTLVSLNNYALVLDNLGRAADAEPLYAEALRLRREVLGDRHPDTLDSLDNYALLLAHLGRSAEVEPLLTEALRLRRDVLGDLHPDTLDSLSSYALALRYLGRAAEAEPLLAEVLRLRREVLGDRHPDTLRSLSDFAGVLRSLDRAAEAEPLYAEALRLHRQVLGDRHPDTLFSLNDYAGVLLSLDRPAEAEPLYAEALRLRREVLGDRHPDTLRSLNNYSVVLNDLGRLEEAEPFSAEALRLSREVLGERHTETLVSLHNHAVSLDTMGRAAEAEPLLAEALRLRREVLGDRHPHTLRSLDGYAGVLLSLGRAADAEPLFAEALRLRREVLGDRHPDTLFSFNHYAIVLHHLGRAAEAEPLYAESLRLRREVLGDRHSDTLRSLSSHASVLDALGRAAEAEPLLAEALRLRREVLGDRHPDTLDSLDRYAGVLLSLGRAAEAEPLYAEALRLGSEVLGERHPATLASLSNYAVALGALGRAADAEPLYAEALRLRRGVLGERHPDTLTSLNNYASVLDRLGRATEAEPIYAEALRLRREVLGERHPDTLSSLSSYASVLDTLGRATAAELIYAEALRLSREVLGERHPDTLSSLNGHAIVLQSLGRALEAEPLYAEALRLRREVLGDRHPDTLTSLYNYAFVLQALDRSAEAEPLYAEELRLSREVLGDRHPDTIISIYNYAIFLLETNQPRPALDGLREVAAAGRARAIDLGAFGQRGSMQRSRERADQERIEGRLADGLWANFSPSPALHDDLREEAFVALQLASAGATTEAVSQAAAARFANGAGLGELVQERQRLTREWTAIEAALVKAQVGMASTADARDNLRLRLGVIEARIGEIDTRLAADAPQYFAILNPQAVTLETLRGILGADEAMLLLVPTRFGTHAMVVTREQIAWHRSDLDEDKLGETVKSFRNGLEIRPGPAGQAAELPEFDLGLAHQLYRDLIVPVEGALEGKDIVYVVADGALSRLPLGTLVTSAPPESVDANDPGVLQSSPWLSDRYALVQLPSLQSLAYLRAYGVGAEHVPTVRYKGFGAPALEGKARTRGARSATLAPVDAATLISRARGAEGPLLMDPAALRRLSALPGTVTELRTVGNALQAGPDALFLGKDMTETAVRTTDLSHTTVLHLATHAFTSEEAGGVAEPGLVFTPPPSALPDDDGYLSASEVVGINLAEARWVILSACNTASPSGRPGETGLSGLAQAFFYAGAQSLLVSHWPVFDDIAPVLTVKALALSRSGLPRAKALQQAMREVRNDPNLDAAHPAVWAPFTLVGDGR